MLDTTTRHARIEFRVLGSIEADVMGAAVEVGGARQRRLLALLLVRAGQVVSTDALVEWLWEDADRPANAVHAVRTYVSRLRRALSAAGADGADLLVTEAPGYRLDLDAVEIDAARFERLVTSGRQAVAEGEDPERALADLDRALGLWRGQPYAEFADQPWAEVEAGRLGEMRIVAAEERSAARLALGAHAEVVGDLEQLMVEHPLRVRPVELLATALHRSSRQADALRAIARHRTELAAIGLEPSPVIAELESRIVAGDAELRRSPRGSRSVAGYEIGESMGSGGVGVVHRAVQPSLGREVAIKQIRAELADQPEFIRRFEAEARIVAGLDHPSIVPLHDYWRVPGSAYLVMRLFRGGSLADVLRTGKRPGGASAVAHAVTVARQIGGALDAAHAAGVVHGDVKPSNILLDESGNHYLGDFGVALGSQVTGAAASTGWSESAAFAAPEQLRGEPVSPAVDVHALAVVLHACLTGAQPFAGASTAHELRTRLLDDPLPALRLARVDVSTAADAVLAQATAKAPGDRFSTAAELVDSFVAALDQPVPPLDTGNHGAIAANPYKGLRPFEEVDAADLCGRGRIVDKLVAALDASGPRGRMVAVVGPSGAGKSSVVRAGLLPRVRRGAVPGSERWYRATMVPGTSPFHELERALASIAVVPTGGLAAEMADRGIGPSLVTVLPADGDLLLVIDQFEELYTHVADDEARRQFLDALHAAVVDPASRLRVVITVRADFWDRPLAHTGLARLLETSAVTVPPLAGDELEEAIVLPARRLGIDVDPALVAAVIADVHDRPSALPLLQHVLTELFERRQGGRMERATYVALGGVAGALARRAEELYGGLSASEQLAARRLFERLVTPGDAGTDTRRRVPTSEIGDDPATAVALQRFGAARLLSFDRHQGTREPTVELAHEALITEWPRLRHWLDEERETLREIRRLSSAAHEWDRADRSTADLARGARLETAVALAAGHGGQLTAVEHAFVDASREEAERAAAWDRRRLRRLRVLLGATAMVAVLALVAGAVAVGQRQRADDSAADAVASAERARRAEQAEVDARAVADLRRIIAESTALREVEPSVSMLLAVEARRLADGPTTLGALLGSLQRTDGYLGHLPARSYINVGWIGFVDDTTLVVRGDTHLDVYDIDERRRVSATDSEGRVIESVLAAVGGGTFATATADGEVLVLRSGETEPWTLELPTQERASAVGVGSNGSLAVGFEDGTVALVGDPSRPELRRIGAHPGTVADLDVDVASGLLVSTGVDASISVWDIAAAVPSPRWTLTRYARDRFVAEVDVGVFFDPWGIVPGGPPPPDLPPQPGLSGFDVTLSADASMVLVVVGPYLFGLDVVTGELAWSAERLGSRNQLQVLGDGRVLRQNRIHTPGGGHEELAQIPAEVRSTINPDGSVLAARSSAGITLWSLDGDQLLAEGLDRDGYNYATLDPTGSVVATLLREPTGRPASVRDVASGERLGVGGSSWDSFTREGDFFMWGDGVIELFDPDSFAPMGAPIDPESPGWGTFEIVSDRTEVVLGDIFENEMRVYDLASGTRVETLGGLPADGVFFMDVSPDGRLVAASVLASVLVWEVDGWSLVDTVVPPEGTVYGAVQFTPDSSGLAIGTSEDEILVHDLEAQRTEALLTGVEVGAGIYHGNTLAFTEDGFVVVATPTSAGIYDVATGQRIGEPFANDSLKLAAIGPGGRHLVTGLDDELLVWRLDPTSWSPVACRAAGRNLTADEWERYGPADEPYRRTCPEWPALG